MKTLKLKPWFYAYSRFHWLDQLPGKLLLKIEKKLFLRIDLSQRWLVFISFFHSYHLYLHLHLSLHLYLYEYTLVHLFSFSLHWEVISIFKNSIFQGLDFGGGASLLLLWLGKSHLSSLISSSKGKKNWAISSDVVNSPGGGEKKHLFSKPWRISKNALRLKKVNTGLLWELMIKFQPEWESLKQKAV